MTTRRFVALALPAVALLAPAKAQTLTQAVTALAERLGGGHPAAYYTEAARLFSAGQREEAVFLFYLGQLRFRTHLAARTSLPRDGDPALFTALSDQVGRPVNEYAFGDIPALLRTLEAVMDFDRRNPDRFTAPRDYPSASRLIREGMVQFHAGLESRRAEIRAARAANGLENRSFGP